MKDGTGNSIGWAVKQLQDGQRVRRAGWNGKGMWLFLIAGNTLVRIRNTNYSAVEYEHLPFVAMKTADSKVVPWLCSQTDLLAADWELAD